MKLPQSITEHHENLKSAKYNVVDTVNSYVERITRIDEDLNSFITLTETQAYSKAKSADEIIKNNPNAFEEFPLLGVVVALKDLYSTKNIRTTAGSKLLEDYVPQYSSTVVERLEKAGAIIIGKTNCDAWAHGASGENSDYGVTKNPWDTTRVPGGSSSGSAVSVAADFSLAALGTDTGGSIRQPASFTNTVGFKPTYGVVPRYGVIAMASSLDSMGHFTHTVEDSEKIFNITKGVDAKDSTIVDGSRIKSGMTSTENFKIGIPREYQENLDPEVKKQVDNAKVKLENLGFEFVDISLPHTKYAVAVYYIVQPAEVSSNLNRFDGVRFGKGRETFSTEAKRRIMLGTYVLSSGYYDAYYLKAMKVRTKIIEDFNEAFKEVDAIFTPVSPTPAFKIGERVDDPLEMYLSDILTVSANLAGIPGLSIPAGFTKSGLPVGFQILGPQFAESTIFEIGKKYQSNTDWHLQKPSL